MQNDLASYGDIWWLIFPFLINLLCASSHRQGPRYQVIVAIIYERPRNSHSNFWVLMSLVRAWFQAMPLASSVLDSTYACIHTKLCSYCTIYKQPISPDRVLN
jgi:hypothetical protein